MLPPYTVTLELTPAEETARPNLLAVTLRDEEYTGAQASESVSLNFDTQLGGVGLSAARFLHAFLAGQPLGAAEGRPFGQYLLQILLGAGSVGLLWQQIQQRRHERPLRMELILPGDPQQRRLTLPQSGAGTVPADTYDLADLPFELLADERNFLFRRHGYSLVRTLRGLARQADTLAQGDRALLAWANPADTEPLGDIVPAFVEQGQATLRQLGLQVTQPVCANASRQSLREALGSNTALLLLLAHGSPQGGTLALHDASNPALTEPLSANDLAQLLRGAAVRFALLWSCYGGRRSALNGSVLTQLLLPEGGNLRAVIGTHAALRAREVPRLTQRLLTALASAAEGDLERAVTEARQELSEEDLQWATPVYYARPHQGRSVQWTLPESLAEGLPAGAEPLVEGAGERTPLFLGRQEDVARGLSHLRTQRVVALTGPGGIGKSELARELAQLALSEGMVARACWFPLTAPVSLEALQSDIASLLLGSAAPPVRNAAELGRALRGKRALLILDNAEDVTREASTHLGLQRLQAELLREAPDLKVLITTRQVLGPFGSVREQEQPVEPLSEPDAQALFLALTASVLVPAEAQSDAARQLVRALEGHPLSLVLTAGLVAQYPVAELERRLRGGEAERLREASLADYTEAELAALDPAELRQHSLVACLDLSYRPLQQRHPQAAEMFLWLGHLPAGLPVRRLVAVFGDTAPSELARLQRLNLVIVQGTEPRARLLAPLRMYARHRGRTELTPQRRQELVQKTWADEGMWLATHARLLGTPRARIAYQQARTEAANLEALLGESGSPPRDDARLIVDAVVHFAQIMQLAGSIGSAISIVQATMVALAGHNNSTSEAIMFEVLGDLYKRTARRKEAEQQYLRALPIFQQSEDRQNEANTLQSLGDLYMHTSRLTEAEQQYLHALPLYRQLHERQGEANTFQSLADLYVRSGRLKEAEQQYLNALPLFRQTKDRLGEANTLRALGDFCIRTARLQEAEQHLLDALSVYEQIEVQQGEANTIQALGDLCVRTSRLPEAEERYLRALTIYKRIEDRIGQANAIRALGTLCVRTARLPEAEQQYRLALLIYKQCEDQIGEANTLYMLGDLFVRTYRLQEVEQQFQLALSIQQQIRDPLGEANTLRALGDFYARTSRLPEAEQQYRLALPIYRRIEASLGEANTLYQLGNLYMRLSRAKDAEQQYRLALPIFQEAKDQLGEANTLLAVGVLCARTGYLKEAEQPYLIALETYRQIGAAQGEANSLKDLGDMYMLMDRLEEAEQKYLGAQDIYQRTKEGLGEANALQGLGNIALKKGALEQAFDYQKQARQQQVLSSNQDGIAAADGYMARIAMSAKQPQRAALLCARALFAFLEMGDRFGQSLAALDLCQALTTAQDAPGAIAAMTLAWDAAREIGSPTTQELAAQLRQQRANFNPDTPLSSELLRDVLEQVKLSVASCAQYLQDIGVELDGPLGAVPPNES